MRKLIILFLFSLNLFGDDQKYLDVIMTNDYHGDNVVYNMPAVSANTQYDRQYDIRSGTINALLLTPANNSLLSIKDNVSSFRWRLNGIEQTNWDIVLNQSLYNDRLLSVLSSGNIKVRNLAPVSFIAGQSIPLSPESQVLQIRLNQGANPSSAKISYLYKQVSRAIKASDTMIQVV